MPTEQPPTSGVKVVCRLRPMNEREKKGGTVPVATASTERREVAVVRMLGGTRKVSSTFHFDDVLTSFSSQAEVFNSTLEPLVGEVLAGYEATAFAYGQTGTGKTYTMEGDVESDSGRGLVPRAAAAVIDALERGKYMEYAVTVSYLEIYNEELSDLLAPPHMQQQKLDLKDGGGGKGVCCQGLSEVAVGSVGDILELVHRAQERRRVAETRVNARSSRSHCIFTMKVRCRRAVATGELENVGKLHLVDLAGSECAKKACPVNEAGAPTTAGPRPSNQTGPTDEERERKSINQSLLTLGRVITALRDGSGRVPYRDSKLTRLLQDSLGGRCKTVIIATISPALSAVEETISTLTYAEQASGIQNRPVASSLLRTLRYQGSGEVRGDGSNTGQGTCDFAELEMKVAYLSQEVEEAQAALARQYREAKDQAERAQAAEERLSETEDRLESAKLSIEEGNYVRAQLVSFADHQSEVASQFTAALRALSTHDDALEGHAASRREEALAGRRQARELLVSAEAQSTAVLQVSSERAAAAAKALDETHAAHAAGTEAAREGSQEQQRRASELVASVRDCGQRLGDQLSSLSAEANKNLDAEQEATSGALDTIETCANNVAAIAGKVKADASAAIARDGEVLGQQAEALREELSAGGSELKASTARVVQDLGAARETATAGHELALKRFRGGLQEPLIAQEAGLAEAARLTGALSAAMVALAGAEAEDAEKALGQREGLLQALAAAASAHGTAVAARPQALGKAHQAVRETLDSNGKAVEASLSSLSSRLDAAKAGLAESTRRSQGALSSAVAGADARLTSAWEEEVARLERLQATLSAASEEQREGHAADTVQQAAAAAAQALTSSLAAAVTELGLARDNIAGQVAELQQQRASEQRIVDMLKQQREALQADVAGQRATLAEVSRELEGVRGELTSLRGAQEQRRTQALEAINAFVAAELSALGDQLGAGAEAMSSRLVAADGKVQSAVEAAAAAQDRSSKLGTEVGTAAGEWSQAVGRSCAAISAAQERTFEAAEAVSAASGAAASALTGLGEEGAKWGAACDRVSGHLGDAAAQRGELSAALEALRPEWQASRERTLEAATAWAQGAERIDGELALVAADAGATGRALEGLHGAVGSRCGEAEAEAGAWRRDAEAHAAALQEARNLGDAMAQASANSERRRAGDVERRGAEAQDISLRAGQAAAQASEHVAVAATHAEAMPVDFASTDVAMASAAASFEGLSSKAGAVLAAGAEGVASLRSAQAAAERAVVDSVSAQADKIANSAKSSGTIASSHRKAAAAALEVSREQWRRSKDTREQVLAALGASAEAASASAREAAEASGKKLQAELSAGQGAKERATAALAALSTEASAGLGRLQASLRSGLAEKPLDVFSEELPSPPARPEAAAWPQIDALSRPTEDQLAEEFHKAKLGEAAFNNTENIVCPRKSPRSTGGDKRLLAKEAWGASGGAEAAGPLHRRALAELNN